MTEDQFQAELWQWSWECMPETRRLLFAVPNGMWIQNPVERNTLKATGVIRGVHDLILIWNQGVYTFEIKVGQNVPSDDQVTWAGLSQRHGARNYLISERHGGRDLFKTILRQIIAGNPPASHAFG